MYIHIALEVVSNRELGLIKYDVLALRVSSVIDILPYEARVAIFSLLAEVSSQKKSPIANI